MNKYLILSLCFFSVILGPAAMAQNALPTPTPKEPILARAPERSEWKIVYRFDHDIAKEQILSPDPKNKAVAPKVPQGRYPKETDIAKDGKTYREITLWSDGVRNEKWIVDGLEVQDTPKGTVVQVMLPAAFYAPDYSDYARSDFEDVEWVGKGNFTGAISFNGTDVFTFETNGNKKHRTPRETADIASGALKINRDAEKARKYQAYLDLHTQLPIYLDDGEVIRTYTYSLNSPGKLVPPPPFAKALDDWKKDIKQRTSMPLPP